MSVPSISFPRAKSLLLNTPLYAHPRAAMTLFNALAERWDLTPGVIPHDDLHSDLVDVRQLHRDRPRIDASRFEGDFVRAEGDTWRRVEPFRLTKDGVGVVTVTGEMVNRGAWHGENSGITSYEGVKDQLLRAGRNPKAKSILLDLETPGGAAMGCAECAAVVRAVAREKPVYAVVNGMAASAGYALASGATRIINTPTGIAGSIGCVMMHLDMSKALQQKGVTPTLIFAGEHKVDAWPVQPLSDDARTELQREVDAFYGVFLETVAAGRGRKLSQKAARETQARTFIGEAAVDAGLADAIGSFEEVLVEATAKARRGASSTSPKSLRSKSMSSSILGDRTVSEEDHARAVTAARAEGVKEGHEAGGAAGAAAERARIRMIVQDPRVAGREIAALDLAIEAPTMSADAVARFLESRVPAASATAPAAPSVPLAERVEGTGVNAVSPGHQAPAAGAPGGGAVVGPGGEWKNFIPAHRQKKR
jgi:signal peptide peptidase SppA